MPTRAPRTAPTTAVATTEPREIDVVRHDLEQRANDLLTVLPAGMSPERFIRVSLMALVKNPELLKCTRSSIITSIIEAAEVGLEPTGGIGGAWLVPFTDHGTKKAQLIYDYRGVQHLIRMGGGGEVETTLVYEGEPFKVYRGTNPRIDHEPLYETNDPTKITHVYAVAMDSGKFEVMPRSEIDRIRARSKAANSGPWVSDYGAQARKTVLKRISAWLPLKPAARAALDSDTEREVADTTANVSESRTSQVRSAIADRLARRGAVAEPETEAAADDAASSASAEQQGDAAAETTDGVCGATSDPKLGDVESCVLDAGHANADQSPSPHKAASGALWPNKAVE